MRKIIYRFFAVSLALLISSFTIVFIEIDDIISWFSIISLALASLVVGYRISYYLEKKENKLDIENNNKILPL